jgi:hypothetical protein
LLDLLIDLIQQAADTAQGEVAKRGGKGEQLDERQLVELKAKGVFGRQVFGAGRPFAQQRGEGETLAGGDFEGGFGAALGRMRALTHNPSLFDDIEMLNRPVGRFDDAFAVRIKTQLTLFNQVRQVRVFHLIEGRESLKELQSALNVLQHRGFPCLCKGVLSTHNHYRSLF